MSIVLSAVKEPLQYLISKSERLFLYFFSSQVPLIKSKKCAFPYHMLFFFPSLLKGLDRRITSIKYMSITCQQVTARATIMELVLATFFKKRVKFFSRKTDYYDLTTFK